MAAMDVFQGTVSVDDGTENRYSNQYEERLDPFSSFSKKVSLRPDKMFFQESKVSNPWGGVLKCVYGLTVDPLVANKCE